MTDSTIEIYDDLLTYAQRETLYAICKTAPFHICGPDTFSIEHQKDYSIVCELNQRDIDHLGILDLEPFQKFKGRPAKGYINICTTTDSDRIHTDGVVDGKGTDVILYMPNLNWELEWQGMLMFTSEDKKSIKQMVEYVPGRFVVFNGAQPHKVCPPSTLAPTFRFTIAIKFEAPAAHERDDGKYI